MGAGCHTSQRCVPIFCARSHWHAGRRALCLHSGEYLTRWDQKAKRQSQMFHCSNLHPETSLASCRAQSWTPMQSNGASLPTFSTTSVRHDQASLHVTRCEYRCACIIGSAMPERSSMSVQQSRMPMSSLTLVVFNVQVTCWT